MKAAKGYAGVPRGLILGGIALAAGLGAALLLAGHVRDRVQQIEAQSRLAMVDRIVAARSLPAGTQLASDHLAVRPFPAEWVGSDTLPITHYGELEGRVLTVPLKAGDAIVPAYTLQPEPAFSAQLAPGRRAITLPVDQLNSQSGLLRPGDLIDLYVSFDYRRKRLTAPLLQGVLVLATGRETRTDLDESRDYSTVTLDAAPEDVLKLVAARQAGTLTAILRHPGDHRADQRGIRGDLAALLGVSVPPPQPRKKPVIMYGPDSARAMPSWATGGAAPRRLNTGWFDLPEAQALASAWMQHTLRQEGVLPLTSDDPFASDPQIPFEPADRPGPVSFEPRALDGGHSARSDTVGASGSTLRPSIDLMVSTGRRD